MLPTLRKPARSKGAQPTPLLRAGFRIFSARKETPPRSKKFSCLFGKKPRRAASA
jgi:hypothetical protein